jgi:hypothetical protein
MISQLTKSIKKSEFNYSFEHIRWNVFFEDHGLFYDGKRFQIALFSPRAGITVYVCNLADGWVSVYENLVKAGTDDAYFFRATLAEIVEYKVFEMKVWRRGFLDRHVRSLREESGWTFLNKGIPMPFEDVERYDQRLIRARLTRAMIENYSATAGFGVQQVTRFQGHSWHFWRNF